MSKRRPKKPVKTTDMAQKLHKALAKRTKDELLDVLVELAEEDRVILRRLAAHKWSCRSSAPRTCGDGRPKRSRTRPTSTNETSTAISATTTKPTAKSRRQPEPLD